MEQSTKHHEPQDHSNLAIQATLNRGISNEYPILAAANYLPSKISKDYELKLLHYSFGAHRQEVSTQRLCFILFQERFFTHQERTQKKHILKNPLKIDVDTGTVYRVLERKKPARDKNCVDNRC